MPSGLLLIHCGISLDDILVQLTFASHDDENLWVYPLTLLKDMVLQQTISYLSFSEDLSPFLQKRIKLWTITLTYLDGLRLFLKEDKLNFLTKIKRYLKLRIWEVFYNCLKPSSTWGGKSLHLLPTVSETVELPEESKAIKN